MVTEKDFNPSLIDTMLEQHKKILVDFANSFLETFSSCISKEELLSRINRLNYIGFERKESIADRCGNADAKFVSSTKVISISNKHKTSDENTIKSLLYHELTHAVSYHGEKNLDSCFNEYRITRTGLDRGVVDFDAKYDGPGFEEGELLEEIMTEYYTTVLLQKEGIDFHGEATLNNYCFDQDYVEYHGTGYYNIAALGRIYDFLFGEDLLQAKLYDGNDFRRRFNELFDNTDVFSDSFNDEGFRVPSYSKFVAQRDTMERYRSACKMFIELFKQKYKDSIRNITDLLQNNDFNTFLSMLVKTRNKFDKSTQINRELFLLLKELEKGIVSELFGSEMKDNEYGVDTDDIETSIFLVIEEIFNGNQTVDLSNVRYAVFYEGNFKGIYLMVGDEKYIIDYKTLSQDIDYAKLISFAEYGFSNEDIDMYSRAYNMDISNAEFATIINPVSHVTFIVKDGKLYNHSGEEIIIEKFNNYFTNLSANGAPSK